MIFDDFPKVIFELLLLRIPSRIRSKQDIQLKQNHRLLDLLFTMLIMIFCFGVDGDDEIYVDDDSLLI